MQVEEVVVEASVVLASRQGKEERQGGVGVPDYYKEVEHV
jgi:hypothetical protein